METILLPFQFILEYWAQIIVACAMIAAVTPTPKDDAWMAKLYKIIDIVGLNFGFAKDKGK